GKGTVAQVDGREVRVGRVELTGSPDEIVRRQAEAWGREGKTVIYVAEAGRVVGALALADTLRDDAAPAVKRLRSLGIALTMATGDQAVTAERIAKALGIERFKAQLDPAGKVAEVEAQQREGKVVGMVG